MHILRKTISLAWLSVLAMACSSAPKVVDMPQGTNPDRAIALMNTRLQDAEARQVNMVCPQNFEKASDLLDKAKEARDHGKSDDKVLDKVAESEAYLGRCEEVSKHAHEVMPGVLEARSRALAAGARSATPNELNEADHYLLKEVSPDFEKGDTKAAENARTTLESRYNDMAVVLEKSKPRPVAQKRVPTVEEKYQIAKKVFSRDEADVYRQGDNLLIRLKGINFESGEPDLTINNPLVSKIQTVMRQVGPTKVTVEGHTDSTGTEDINKKLSYERAKVLGDFLVNHNLVQPDSIEVLGAGESKPIASNKTKSGRAQNRRVDLILSNAHEDEGMTSEGTSGGQF